MEPPNRANRTILPKLVLDDPLNPEAGEALAGAMAFFSKLNSIAVAKPVCLNQRGTTAD